MGCTASAVLNIVHNKTKAAAADDTSEDWKYVDDDFKTRFYQWSSESTEVFIS
jgi:hypothetical protein